MSQSLAVKQFFCWLFISTLMVSSVQISIAGFQADDSSWFQILTTLLAEEEREDSEKEEDHKPSKEYISERSSQIGVKSNKYFHSLDGKRFQSSVIREVFSPPPEA